MIFFGDWEKEIFGALIATELYSLTKKFLVEGTLLRLIRILLQIPGKMKSKSISLKK